MTPSTGAGQHREPASLAEVRRGPIVESRHRGHIAAVTPSGGVIARLGDPGTVTFLRSSAKPHQAIPLVASGAADRFGLSEGEIAIACASHNGESIHTEAVRSILGKAGLGAEALKCGIHEPFSSKVALELRSRGDLPGVLQNNCSGKHAGMLALALHMGAPPESYDDPEGQVQQAILTTVSQFSSVSAEEIAVGTDGCGVPVFAVPVSAMALMFARLVRPPPAFGDNTRDACSRIIAAMTRHPELIGGTTDRLDTEVMRALPGGIVSKVGAEGVYTAAILPCERWPGGLGLALKIEDGEDRRARPVVVIEALRQLGVLNNEAAARLARYSRFEIHNHRGDLVGSVEAAFELEFV